MDDWFASEEFARAPVARVLAEIWRQGLSGSLYVRAGGVPKCLSFERGSLVLDSVSFEEKDFLRYLLTTGETDLIALTRVEEHVQKTGGSTLRSLVETSLFEPDRLWDLLRTYARGGGPVALRERRGRARVPHPERPAGPGLRGGHRRPRPPARGRPEDDGRGRPGPASSRPAARPSAGCRPSRPTPSASPSPSDTSSASSTRPGRSTRSRPTATPAPPETRRALCALLLLGLAGTAGPKPKTARLGADLSLAGMDRIMGLFNARCAFVFKHVSKEVGPVAFNLIEKALDEVRGRLDPAFQSAELKPDGRLELKSLLRVNANIVGDELPPVHAPEHGRDPGRRGPRRQADARPGSRIRPRSGAWRGSGRPREAAPAPRPPRLRLRPRLWILIKIGT